jgi:hypothetical protein
MSTASARVAIAQSVGDLAAWDALVVTPVGALSPRQRSALYTDSARTELSFRYGRWRYDIDDAIHNNMGITYGRQLGFAHTGIAVTAAYLSLSCGGCQAWMSGGIEAQTQLYRLALGGDSLPDLAASLGLRTTAGAARFMGEGHAVATSASAAATFGLAFPWAWSSRILISVLPGYGVGRFSSVDETAYGTRPMLGGSMLMALPSGFVMDFGFQRIVIDGGPSQIGAALSWMRR